MPIIFLRAGGTPSGSEAPWWPSSDRIIGLVLVAPVLDWAETLTSNASAIGLPEPVAKVGLKMLGAKAGRSVIGLAQPLNLPGWIGWPLPETSRP